MTRSTEAQSRKRSRQSSSDSVEEEVELDRYHDNYDDEYDDGNNSNVSHNSYNENEGDDDGDNDDDANDVECDNVDQNGRDGEGESNGNDFKSNVQYTGGENDRDDEDDDEGDGRDDGGDGDDGDTGDIKGRNNKSNPKSNQESKSKPQLNHHLQREYVQHQQHGHHQQYSGGNRTSKTSLNNEGDAGATDDEEDYNNDERNLKNDRMELDNYHQSGRGHTITDNTDSTDSTDKKGNKGSKDVHDSQDHKSNQSTTNAFVPMGSHGEHKRAVSSVRIAPPRICKNRSPSSSSSSRFVPALIASASADGTCKVWDFQNVWDNYCSLESHANPTSTSLSSISRTINTSGPKTDPLISTIAGIKRLSLAAVTSCTGHSRGINEVSWNTNSPLLATASDDKTIRLWDAVTGDALVELRGHDNYVFCVDQKGDTNLLVSGSFDETVKLWDIRTAQCVSTIPAHSDPVTAVSLNRDGTTVASSSHDGLIRIWDVATGECLKTIYAAGNPPVSSIKYSPNGKYLLASTLDSAIRLWPITLAGTNRCAKTYRDPTVANVPSGAPNPTQSALSSLQAPSTSSLPTAPIVDNSITNPKAQQQKQQQAQPLQKQRQFHVNTKYSIVSDFTCTGDIVTGSETGDVVVYNLQERTIQQVLSGHTDVVLAVSAHDTIPLIASGGMTNDKKVEFWYQIPS